MGMYYRFADCALDMQRRELCRVGHPIPLRRKALQLLAYLMAHHDRLVSKDELLEQLWPQQFVGDATLNSCLREVRRAVGDNGRDQQIIRTIRGSGYRVMASVEVRAETGWSDTIAPCPGGGYGAIVPIAKPAYRFKAFGTLANLDDDETPPLRPTPQSIAVLPFADLSPGQDLGYFCDGVAAEVMSHLVRVDGLEVAARTSAFQFKGSGRDIRDIGRRLDVHTVLEGRIRRDEDRLRINAQLVDVANGYLLWSERYDRTLTDILSLRNGAGKSRHAAWQMQLDLLSLGLRA